MGDNQSYNHHQRVPNTSLESNHPTGFKDIYHHRRHDYRNRRMDDNQPYPNEYSHHQRAAPNKSLDANNSPINRNIYHHRRHGYRKGQWTIGIFSQIRI